jgi:large subunit ribosomal protein L17
MINNMATSLFAHGSIRTTQAKAKELRSIADRLISFAKRGDLHARRQVLRRIRNKVVVSRLFDEIAPTFSERDGGYTRVLKLAPRRGDSVELCLVELVGEEIRADYASRASSKGESATEAPAAGGDDGAEEVDGEEAAEEPEDAAVAEEEDASAEAAVAEETQSEDPNGAEDPAKQEDDDAPQESDKQKD